MRRASATLARALVLASALLLQPGAQAHAQTPAPGPPARPRIRFDEVLIGAGFAQGHLKKTDRDFALAPLFVRVSFDISGLVGFDGQTNSMQLGVEPFWGRITRPAGASAYAVDLVLRYRRALAPRLDLYLEIGGGPGYLGIDTEEQGAAGFNFIDQIGAGLRFRLGAAAAISAGGRWVHISRADLDTDVRADLGIDAPGVGFGLSWIF
jgi:lipid A 3-O-deacylase